MAEPQVSLSQGAAAVLLVLMLLQLRQLIKSAGHHLAGCDPLRGADPHNLGSPLGFYLEVDGFGDVPCGKESTDANLQARLNARNCAFH